MVCGEARRTYRELDEEATRLAHRLVELGVGADSIVGLYLDRSVEIVVGMLAVLKAGGAYLPLDPEVPAERLAFIAKDARVHVVITRDAALEGPWTTLRVDEARRGSPMRTSALPTSA